jgi:hypothetical protein
MELTTKIVFACIGAGVPVVLFSAYKIREYLDRKKRAR